MLDATISRARLHDLACLGRSRPEANDLVASSI